MAFGFGFGLPRGGNTVWSPASLFAQNEPGVWYDPSDMTTLFQDAAGTTPVTAVEQAVGLMLDKSRGLALGPNIAPTAFSGYNATVSNGGVFPCVVTSTVNNNFGVVASSLLTVGKYYEFVISWVGNTNGKTLRISDGSNTGAFSNAVSGTLTNRIVAGFASIYAYIVSGAIGETFTITSITTKEITGIHATSLTTSRPVLTARVNLLTKTEQFNDAAWNVRWGGAATVVSNDPTFTAPDGTITVDKVTNTVGGSGVGAAVTLTAGVSYTLSAWANAATSSGQLQIATSNSGGGQVAFVTIPTTAGLNRYSVTYTPSVTQTYYVGSVFGVGAVQYIWGASLTTANQASLGYQRVNTATDYDTVGFPMWLKADGVDDYMVTGTLAAPVNLNLTSTDKVTVATGVRKLSDAAPTQILTELSASTANAATWGVQVSRSVAGTPYAFESGGSIPFAALASSGAATSPDTRVLTGTSNIGGDLATIRLNGTQVGQSTADQGTGNYGTYPLYQFRRGGTSNPFNGLSAGLTVVGRTLTAAELSQLETYYQQKTKAY